MDYSILLPREKHAAFRWLGKVDGAFTIKDGGEVRTTDALGREIISGKSVWVVNEHRIANTDGWAQHRAMLMPMLVACKKPGMGILTSALDAHAATKFDTSEQSQQVLRDKYNGDSHPILKILPYIELGDVTAQGWRSKRRFAV